MKRVYLLILAILFLAFYSRNADGGKAGVGVINVTPTYKSICLRDGRNAIELKLSISDYNSWKDVYKVDVLVEGNGKECAYFSFLHYDDKDSFNEINLFVELKGKGYLLEDLCNVERSLFEKSIDDRCLINITFVFKPVPYSDRLIVIAYDREGERATLDVQFNPRQVLRNDEFILPFWTEEPIRISPDIPDISACSISITSVAFIILRRYRYYE